MQLPFPQRLARRGLRALVAAPRLVESQVFGVLHQHGLIRLGVRRVRRQLGESRLQGVLGTARQLRHLLVESAGYLRGRFLMTPAAGSRPALESRLVAVALADQVGAALIDR